MLNQHNYIYVLVLQACFNSHIAGPLIYRIPVSQTVSIKGFDKYLLSFNNSKQTYTSSWEFENTWESSWPTTY